ncbi:MAG: 3' terminal RNA ribose 2'-O-methyltransferase Hen1 [Smithella sp.]|nr:3' terminal RNA ribose 2'-O-methyltransferase Hen1 [Smithella sp.]
MLLTISTTHKPATDLGYLMHKNPIRCQSSDLAFGTVHIFYPEANEDKCSMAMVLDIDPVEIIRSRKRISGTQLEQYINDRPYVASSFVSVAIAQVLGSALKGQCKDRPELIELEMPLVVKISVLPSRGGQEILYRLFEPLGYEMSIEGYRLDEKYEEWGQSSYYTVELKKTTTVKELLSHLYVLIPVLDNHKHYYIGRDEVEKLLQRGQGWLAHHPEKELIAKRYLKFRSSLAREALARLVEEEISEIDEENASTEEEAEREISLNEERLKTVISVLKETDVKKVIDLGCGEGQLLKLLLKEKQFEQILGMDVSIRSLEIARQKLHLDNLPATQRKRIELIHGSLMYRDKRFEGFDAATVIEVIEHMDPPRLVAFERVVFEFAKPKTVIITTPNKEYNVVWETLEADKLRHGDHRFEWTREEFQNWCETITQKYDYQVRFMSIGPEQERVGCPTQMGVFTALE